MVSLSYNNAVFRTNIYKCKYRYEYIIYYNFFVSLTSLHHPLLLPNLRLPHLPPSSSIATQSSSPLPPFIIISLHS